MPKLLWTQGRQRRLEQMFQDPSNRWAELLRLWADNPGLKYAAGPTPGAVCYLGTGQRDYARAAWNLLTVNNALALVPPTAGRNDTREYLWYHCWLLDTLSNELTEGERAGYLAYIDYLGRLCLDQVDGVQWGTRASDSDETIGHYFGLRMLDILDGGQRAASRPDLPAAIQGFLTLAAGGTWFESSMYNLGTLKLLLWGWYGVLTATGQDELPALRALLPSFGYGLLHQMTPDLLDSYQWGDEQNPHQLWHFHRCALLQTLASLCAEFHPTDPVSGYLTQLFNELVGDTTQNVSPSYPEARGFILYDHTLQPLDWRSALPLSYHAPGVGLTLRRTGWGAGHTLAALHTPNPTKCDHETEFRGTFGLYKVGAGWAFTIPYSYGGTTGNEAGFSVDGISVQGIGTMYEARGMADRREGPGWVYHAGVTGGRWAWEGYYNPPPTYCHELSDQIVYLEPDTIVRYVRADTQDPRTLPGYDQPPGAGGYYTPEKVAFETAAARLECSWHMPETPEVVEPGRYRWQTPVGEARLRVWCVNGSGVHAQVIDEHVTPPPGSTYESERRSALITMPEKDVDWLTMLNVLSVGEVTAEYASGEGWEGAVVRRPGKPDVTVRFRSVRDDRLPETPMVNNRCVYDPGKLTILAQRPQVWIETGATQMTYTTATDPSGNYALTSVVPGQYVLTIPEDAVYEAATSAPFSVAAGQTTIVNVTRKKKATTGSVTGQVTNDDGSGAQVTVQIVGQ